MAATAIAGATIAALGLREWRRQLHGQTDYELARRYLGAVLKVRDGIRAVRNPVMGPGEIAAARRQAGEDASPIDTSRSEYIREAYAARWERLSKSRSDLQVEALEAEVLWGKESQAVLVPLSKAIGKLYAALHRYLAGLDRPDEVPGKGRESVETWERLDAIIYEISEDPTEDKFSGEIASAISSIEEFVAPRLRL